MVIAIEDAWLKTLNAKLDRLLEISGQTGIQEETKMKWITNLQLSQMLNVSLRTLQSYRDTGLLGFTKVGRKISYKSKDVESFMDSYHSKAFVQKRRTMKDDEKKTSSFQILKNGIK